MKNITKILFQTAICILLLSCSSDDTESLYDSVLSNTKWQQVYITPASSVAEEEIPWELMKKMLSRLQSETRIDQETDTINKTSSESGKYLLSFGTGEKCQLENTYHIKGVYQLATYEVEVNYYPNQTYREDVGNGYTTEITVKDDSLTLRQFYGDRIVKQDTVFLEKSNEIRTKIQTLNVSEPYDYENDEISETYHMTYIRSGNKVELKGDKHLIGVISDDHSEIDFEEYGSFGRE